MTKRSFHISVKVTGPITLRVTGLAITTLVLGLGLLFTARYGG